MHIPLLTDIVVIFGLAVAVQFVFLRLRLPSLVGLLFTGILAGPHGLGLVDAVHEVEVLAEIGVVLLLFTIGIEFSFQKLVEIRRAVLVGGSLQVGLTILAVFLLARWAGASPGEAVFYGFLVSLSSTAIVLGLIQQRGEVDSPHGRITLGMLLFQDVIVVPMLLVTPLLAGAGQGGGWKEVALFAGRGLGIVVLVLASARWLMPWVLHQVARTRSKELFLLCVVAVCLTTAWLTASAGLSLALGAFLAGLIMAESDYSH
ncbi:MAG TPA: potassium transporter KefB, partial [Desulfobacterales bacterium]|nr:potassium transporter KefB [Desulfobacterales bacterium]